MIRNTFAAIGVSLCILYTITGTYVILLHAGVIG